MVTSFVPVDSIVAKQEFLHHWLPKIFLLLGSVGLESLPFSGCGQLTGPCETAAPSWLVKPEAVNLLHFLYSKEKMASSYNNSQYLDHRGMGRKLFSGLRFLPFCCVRVCAVVVCSWFSALSHTHTAGMFITLIAKSA